MRLRVSDRVFGNSPVFLTSSEEERSTSKTFYQQILEQDYKRLGVIEIEGYKTNNIIPVTLVAAIFTCMGEADFPEFNTLFIRAFGVHNQIHAQVLWDFIKSQESEDSIMYHTRACFDFPPMVALMNVWDKSIPRDTKEKTEFEQKTPSALHPNLCSDEAYLLDKICRRLEIKICVLISQTQQIIFGEQYKKEIILVRKQSNEFYFFVSPKIDALDLDQSIPLDKYQLPFVINHFDTSRRQATFRPGFRADTFKYILSFLHRKTDEDQLEYLRYVDKFFNLYTAEYIKNYFRKGMHKFSSIALEKNNDNYKSSIEQQTMEAVLTKDPRALEIPYIIAAKWHQSEKNEDKDILIELDMPEEQISEDRQLALKQCQVTEYVALGKPAELKAFLESKENVNFDLNFYHDIFISLSFLNALLPNKEIEAILNQYNAKLIPVTSEAIMKYLDRINEMLGNKYLRRESILLINILVKRLPGIALLKCSDARQSLPMAMCILNAGIVWNYPILEAVNHLMLLLAESKTPLSEMIASNDRPWISCIFDGEDSFDIGENAINILEVALKNGLDKSFFTSEDPKKVEQGIECLHILATLPLRVLQLFSTIYPDFYTTNIDRPIGELHLTTLHTVAASLNPQNVLFLLESKLVNIRKTDANGSTFFHSLIKWHRQDGDSAYQAMYLALVDQLFQTYPELKHFKTKAGLTPFLLACSNYQYYLLELVEITYSRKERDNNGNSALHLVFMDRNVCFDSDVISLTATARKLLAMRYDVNLQNQKNKTPIVTALEHLYRNTSRYDFIRVPYGALLKLIEQMLSIADDKQFTPNRIDALLDIIFSLKNYYQESLILVLLKRCRLSCNTKIKSSGETLLSHAVKYRFTEVVRYFLTKMDVDVTVSSYFATTPFRQCCISYEREDDEMIDLFLQHPQTDVLEEKGGVSIIRLALLRKKYELAFKLLTSEKMQAHLPSHGTYFMSAIFNELFWGGDLHSLNKMLIFLLNRSDIKFDVMPKPYESLLREAFNEARMLDTFKLMLIHPKFDTDFLNDHCYIECMRLCSTIDPLDTTGLKNSIIAARAILKAEVDLKMNKFKEAEHYFKTAKKFDEDLVGKYLSQIFDRFKTCYSFTPEQTAFLSSQCRTVTSVVATVQTVNPGLEEKTNIINTGWFRFLGSVSINDDVLSRREFRISKR